MRIDSREFPLIVVRWSGTASDQEVTQFISELTALADRAIANRQHYAVVSVGESLFSPAQRKQLSHWVDVRAAQVEHWDLGNFVVLNSPLARGVLTAVRWMTPKLEKVFTFSNAEEALRAARERLAASKPQRTL